jgi:pilus assembly protein FimV
MVIPYRPDLRSGHLLRRCGAALTVWGVLALAPSQAATFGHARLASAAGQPLVVVVPVTGLTAADVQALSARPAPASAWVQAGLTPPVALDSLTVSVAPGAGAKTDRELHIQSSQPFSGPLADILLDVRTATGSERYQVSLIGPGPARGLAAGQRQARPSATSGRARPALGAARAPTSVRRVPVGSIRVRRGDTMFAIGRRHAVNGVSIYQLMLALQRANSQAFIHQNINLVRAGASLAVPDVADMLSISDAEARRQFVAQTAAFNRLREQHASRVPAAQTGGSSAGAVSPSAGAEAPVTKPAQGDLVRLSDGKNDQADARTAQGHALADAESRVGQLQDNVQNLNQALQTQGEAARKAVASGANAIGDSIEKIAGAISQASHEAAAQANDRSDQPATAAAAATGPAVAAGSAAPRPANGAAGGATAAGSRASAVRSPGPGASARGSAAPATSSSGSAPMTSSALGTPAVGTSTQRASAQDSAKRSSTAPGSAQGTTASTPPSSAGASASDARRAVSPESTTSSAAGPASSAAAGPSAAKGGLFGATDAPADEAKAHANAEATELHASEQTRHRVNWLQDHLLGVMTGLLALIVFIIAWLLRRANTARDETDADPRVTEAMVQEKLRDIDLELPPAQRGSPAAAPEA